MADNSRPTIQYSDALDKLAKPPARLNRLEKGSSNGETFGYPSDVIAHIFDTSPALKERGRVVRAQLERGDPSVIPECQREMDAIFAEGATLVLIEAAHRSPGKVRP